MDFSEQLFSKFSGCRLFCGFSGGADSTAALLLARKYAPRWNCTLEAVHFNHHLRGAESDAEAEQAAEFARNLQIPFRCIDLHIDPHDNLESAAREARLNAWKTLTAGTNSAVILGHHADDRRENLLIRLCRGSNSHGLSSMRSVAVVDGVTFIRPLLRMTRTEIELFLKENGVESWAVDSSNASGLFLRNYLRNTLLPGLESRFPGALKGMERSLNALEADADFINDFVSSIPIENKKSISFWQKQHTAVRIRLLRELTGVVPTGDLLEELNKALLRTTPELRKLPVAQDKVIWLRNDLIEMAPLQTETPAPFLWKWRETPVCRWGTWRFSVSQVAEKSVCGLDTALFDGDQLPEVLEIAFPVPGERMQVFGGHSLQKIKKLRTDRHIGEGTIFPLLRGEQGVYWAPFIRHSALAAVSETSQNIIKFEIIKE